MSTIGAGGDGSRLYRPRLLLWVALAWVGLCGGCGVGRAMIAGPVDYGDYRRIRLAESFDERLAAAWYYLEHHPDGVYAERIRRYVRKAEPVFFEVRRRSDSGLEAYLQALPHGPHADEALAELMRRRRAARRDRAADARAAAAGERLDAERARRELIADLPLRWTRMLLDGRLWSGPLAEAPAELLVAFRLELPKPDCRWDDGAGLYRCTKLLDREFPVFDGGELSSHALTMWIELELDERWWVRSARLFGPELFLRLEEARSRRALPPQDHAARRQAREDLGRRAMELLAEPERACVPGDSTAALSARCGAVQVEISTGEDDYDEIRLTLVEQAAVSAPGATGADPAAATEPPVDDGAGDDDWD